MRQNSISIWAIWKIWFFAIFGSTLWLSWYVYTHLSWAGEKVEKKCPKFGLYFHKIYINTRLLSFWKNQDFLKIPYQKYFFKNSKVLFLCIFYGNISQTLGTFFPPFHQLKVGVAYRLQCHPNVYTLWGLCFSPIPGTGSVRHPFADEWILDRACKNPRKRCKFVTKLNVAEKPSYSKKKKMKNTIKMIVLSV